MIAGTFVLEKKEVEKILLQLSLSLAPFTEELGENVKILSHLDFVFAKAKLANKMDGVKPILNQERKTVLLDARHPLIPKDKVVPISIRLGDDFSLLVITGPNTGGKTVCLKTFRIVPTDGAGGSSLFRLSRAPALRCIGRFMQISGMSKALSKVSPPSPPT